MYIDIGAYFASKKTIISWLSVRDRKNLISNISMIAAITSCPCIAVAYYAGEEFGWTPEIAKYIKKMIDFYGYDEIRNKPEGSPI